MFIARVATCIPDSSVGALDDASADAQWWKQGDDVLDAARALQHSLLGQTCAHYRYSPPQPNLLGLGMWVQRIDALCLNC